MNFILKAIILLVNFYSFCRNTIFVSTESAIIGRKLLTVFEKRNYVAYCGIPYAVPPVGDLRFKPTKAHPFVKDHIHDYSYSETDTCTSSLNEDCLRLSVYSPFTTNETHRFPVLVWIHEHSNNHGPDFFIDEEVLVVMVSFRTSIFGFLCTGDNFAEGNMGAKDVIMALKWIRENISIFRGDPSTVTVAGSGVGGTIVASLILSAAAEDLYSRVIVLGGSALSPADYEPYTFEIENKLYFVLTGSRNKFNRTKFYKILNNASTTKLISVSQNLFDSSEVRDKQRLINAFTCIAENSSKFSFIDKSPLEVYKKKMVNNHIHIMLGFTNLEGLHKLGGLADNRRLLKCLNYSFQYLLPFEGRRDEYNSNRYTQIRKRIMDFYFLNGTIRECSLKRYAKYHSDQVVYPLLRQATLHLEATCSNVYLYRFGFKGAFNIGWKSSVPNLNWAGATSGDEICYLFRCKSVNDVYKGTETLDERHFIKKIVRLMANFVKYGNPTPNVEDNILNILKWEPLLPGHNLKGMNLQQNLRMIKLPEEKRMKFWDQLKTEFFTNNVIKEDL